MSVHQHEKRPDPEGTDRSLFCNNKSVLEEAPVAVVEQVLVVGEVFQHLAAAQGDAVLWVIRHTAGHTQRPVDGFGEA